MKDTKYKRYDKLTICICMIGLTTLLSGCEDTDGIRKLPDFDGELTEYVVDSEITYNLDEDIANGLIFADKKGNVVRK